jgi:hypothetical protein
MNSEAGHGLSNQDLATRHMTTKKGLRYTIVHHHPAIRPVPPARGTALAPGWTEGRYAKGLPRLLQEDRDLLALVEFLAYEIGPSPARLAYGDSTRTGQRLQKQLTQGSQPTSVSRALVLSQAFEQAESLGLPRRGIRMETEPVAALANLGRTHNHLAIPHRHCPSIDLAKLRGNLEEHRAADWITVSYSRNTMEGTPSPFLHAIAQKDGIRVLAALAAEDIVYVTSLPKLGYGTRIILGCLIYKASQGTPFSARQHAVVAAAECAIGYLRDICNFMVSPARGPQPELSQTGSDAAYLKDVWTWLDNFAHVPQQVAPSGIAKGRIILTAGSPCQDLSTYGPPMGKLGNIGKRSYNMLSVHAVLHFVRNEHQGPTGAVSAVRDSSL